MESFNELLTLQHLANGTTRWTWKSKDFAGAQTTSEHTQEAPGKPIGDWPLQLMAHPTLGQQAVASRPILAGELLFTDVSFSRKTEKNVCAGKACRTCYESVDDKFACCRGHAKHYEAFCSHAAGSCFNHSCMPSAVASFLGPTIRLHALHDLNPGEEVTISYLEGLQSAGRAQRQASLRAARGFTCVCARCVQPPPNDLSLEGWACQATGCQHGVVPSNAVQCLACGAAHALAPPVRAAMEMRWREDVDRWWSALLGVGGDLASKGVANERVAYEMLPKLDQLLTTSAGRLCETHALRQSALALRSHAVAACKRAPPAALVEAIEDCIRSSHRHLHRASPAFCCLLHRLARALTQQAAALAAEDGPAAVALRRRSGEAAHAAAQGLAVTWGAEHPTVREWRAMAAASEEEAAAAPSPVAVWEPLEGFDEYHFLMMHWPGWEFRADKVTAFRRQVETLNRRIGRAPAEAYQAGLRLKIRTPPFLTFEQDWERQLGDVVDVPAVQRLVADLRTNHDRIVAEYNSVPEALLSDSATHMLTGGKLWVEAFPQQMPCLLALLRKHRACLSPVLSDTLSQGSISILRPGAVSKPHTGQFNLRLRLHYPLAVPPEGPELAGAERSYGNAWSRGVFLIDDAQLHAVRNTGETKRSIVLCDILRTDIPRISPDLLTKLQ